MLCLFIIFAFFKMFLFNFERERERETERKQGRAGREGDTESEAGSRLCADSSEPHVGLELVNHKIMA